MSAIIPILIGIAAKVGAPIVKGILEKHAGPLAGSVAETVINTVAEKAGTTADDLVRRTDGQLEAAVQDVEAEAPELVAQWVESQRLANELQLAEMSKEQTWTWAWRPAWMWFLGFLWLWRLVLVPLVDTLVGSDMAKVVDVTVLIGLTTVYTGLYMGGHTLKSLGWGKK